MLKCLMTLEFVGLVGMLTIMIIKRSLPHLYKSHISIFCFSRILWRFFGLSSGCVAFLLAVERYFALTKPFFYCRHFTNGVMKRLIFTFWTFAAVLSFAPVCGFGIFLDEQARKCERYRDATKTWDVAYAFLFFFNGSTLCIFMVVCNVSVSRMVYRSYRNMKQLTVSSSENFNRIQSIKLHHQISEVSTTSTVSKSVSITQDEIAFINMVNLLTGSFVICWGTGMITIPIAQFYRNANHSKAMEMFFHFADMLLLLHFALDPFIYVLCRTDYYKRFKNVMSQIFCSDDDEFAESPEMDRNRAICY
ncbi:beta-1 adrenergic receptor [Chironomus tepperi]|uniref:beta-1 adrenergic receptor n=1 Tax=Chironomus tepperi TaxID=113505 RepID=UPI00391F52B2